MADELFTVAQAAEYLKVCDKTVRRMIASKELVASKVGSRCWRYMKADGLGNGRWALYIVIH